MANRLMYVMPFIKVDGEGQNLFGSFMLACREAEPAIKCENPLKYIPLTLALLEKSLFNMTSLTSNLFDPFDLLSFQTIRLSSR